MAIEDVYSSQLRGQCLVIGPDDLSTSIDEIVALANGVGALYLAQDPEATRVIAVRFLREEDTWIAASRLEQMLKKALQKAPMPA